MALFQVGVHTNASPPRSCDIVQLPPTAVKSTPLTKILSMFVGVEPAVTALVTLPPASPMLTMVTSTSFAKNDIGPEILAGMVPVKVTPQLPSPASRITLTLAVAPLSNLAIEPTVTASSVVSNVGYVDFEKYASAPL